MITGQNDSAKRSFTQAQIEEQQKKEVWKQQMKNQEDFMNNPKSIQDIVECKGGLIAVAKDRIGGFTQMGNNIISVPTEKMNIFEIEFMLKPHYIAGCDPLLKENMGVEQGQHILLKREALGQSAMEITVNGVLFYLFESYNIGIIVKDIDTFRKGLLLDK